MIILRESSEIENEKHKVCLSKKIRTHMLAEWPLCLRGSAFIISLNEFGI